METLEVFEYIFKTADVLYEQKDKTFQGLRRQLRYYNEDIPIKPRYLYDADAVWFYNQLNDYATNKAELRDWAERGDIMTSMWSPLTFYLDVPSDNKGRVPSKNKENINNVLTKINCMKEDKILELAEQFSQRYVSRGNLLLLPNAKNKNGKRRLNNDKYSMSEDKLDQFLLLCLDGKLKEYFDGISQNVEKWIKTEHLECMFSEDFFSTPLEVFIEKNEEIEIKIDNLQSLIDDRSRIKNYRYRELNDDKWKTYFSRLIKVINYRNQIGIDNYLPLEWNHE